MAACLQTFAAVVDQVRLAEEELARRRQALRTPAQMLLKAVELVESCDLLVRKHFPDVDPKAIRPSQTYDRYGGRGALRDAMLEALPKEDGAVVTKTELAIVLETRFALVFATEKERVRWKNNGLGPQLRRFMREGPVEMVDCEGGRFGDGRYRLKSGASRTIADLKARVEASGGSVLQEDARDDD